MPDPEEVQLAEALFATGRGAPSVDQKVQIAQTLRRRGQETSARVDRALIARHDELHVGLQEAGKNLQKLEAVLEQVSAPPWHVADFIRMVDTPMGPRALVACNGRRTLVTLHPEMVQPGELDCGDEVLLGNQLNVLMARSPLGPRQYGETADFSRRDDAGRLVLRSRDEEIVVEPVGGLREAALQEGDRVRWDRTSWLAHEKLESPNRGRRFLLSDVEDVPTHRVGGQDKALSALIAALTTTLVDPEKAKRYGLTGRQSVLMTGPPGCGKTLITRAALSAVARASGRRCRFGVVKPSEWEDPYVGVTEQNIRNCFRALREEAEQADALAVLYLDEIETAGRIRGGMANHHADRFLGALLAELDGFDGRGNVAIVSSTNRKDLMDPALRERVDGIEIPIGRPDRKGARAIFDIHLPSSAPLCPNHSSSAATRLAIVETAVSMLYAPNAGNELCVLHFRDRSTRTVWAREMVSGRLIEQICRQACQSAFLRDTAGGEAGVAVDDMRDAVAQAIGKLSTTLSPRNVHAYLGDLSGDTDIVDVRPIERKVTRPHRYRAASVA